MKIDTRKKLLRSLPIVLLLGLVLLIFLKREQLRQLIALTPGQSVQQAECNLGRQPCTAQMAGGEIEVELQPRPLHAMEQGQLRLHIQGIELQSAQIDFTMADMDMGLNRFTLKPAGAGQWLAAITLPVCMQGSSEWIATLALEDAQGKRWQLRWPLTVAASADSAQ